ncbi:MAG: gliding motility protein GldL [Bacteroidales bacterium]|nr:gliding motility protein GldL [Bacteroidales bacterium]
MNLTEIVESAGWKNFMAKLYGMGATVVIVGALFKINHWPGGVYFITAGMTVEAIIFFFSSFEPLHEELDWTLVYPELAGMSDPDELENFKANTLGTGDRIVERVENVLAGGAPAGAIPQAGGVQGGLSTEAVESMQSFKAGDMPDMEVASKATKEYSDNIQKAATAVMGLHETYSSSSENLKESATSLTQSYFQTADTIVKSGEEVANVYKEVANAIAGGNLSIAEGSKNFKESMLKLNDNLSTLNNVYEEQIKESSERMKGSNALYAGLQDMMINLKDSVDETNKYKEEMSKLKDSISSLNSIYGNMLHTLESTKKKNS